MVILTRVSLHCRYVFILQFVFNIRRDNFIQIPQDISTAYSGIGQSLHNHVTSYHPLSSLGSLGSLGSPLLISNINSLPPLSTPQMSLQVQNMPIIPTSNISKPQISGSSEKSRSTLLDNFRSNLLPLLGLSDLGGHVLEFAKDQHGSRFIQQKLEMASKAEKDKIFDEIFPSILSLMTDVFGNYVIQKFVEHGSEEHQRNILVIVLPNVESLTVQMYGCRVIQKLLDASSLEQRKLIFRVSNQPTSVVCRVSSRLLSVLVLFNFSFLVNFLHDEVVLKFRIYLQKLEPKLEEYIQDHNGNHVIQKCIELLDTGDKQIILDRYAGKVITRELSYKNLYSVEYTIPDSPHFLPSLRVQNRPETAGALLPKSDRSPARRAARQHRPADPGPVRELRDPAHPGPRRGRLQVPDSGQTGGPSADVVPAQVCQQRGGEVRHQRHV